MYYVIKTEEKEQVERNHNTHRETEKRIKENTLTLVEMGKWKQERETERNKEKREENKIRR